LEREYSNYRYNGKTVRYTLRDYDEKGEVINEVDLLDEYRDENMLKLQRQVGYSSDGAEQFKTEYSYDELGRENGVKFYLYNMMWCEYSAYGFENKTVSHTVENFDNKSGKLIDRYKKSVTYWDSAWLKPSVYIVYNPDGTVESREEFSYDAKGRSNGFKFYKRDTLMAEHYNYRVEGKTIRYTVRTIEGYQYEGMISFY